ncbi:MAG: alpha/beta hydrolase [Marinomonas sp.]
MSRAITPLLILLALLTAQSCKQASEPHWQDPSEQLEVSREPHQGSCAYNKILPSSDGDQLALFREEPQLTNARNFNLPAGFAVLNGEPKLVGQKIQWEPQSDVFIGGVKRLQPIGWNDRQLFFRMGPDTIVDAQLNGDWTFSFSELPSAWRTFEVRSFGAASLDSLFASDAQDLALDLNDRADLRRRTLFLGEKPHFFAVDAKNSQQLLGWGSGEGETSFGPANFLHHLAMAAPGNGAVPIALGEPNGVGSDKAAFAYARAVIEHQTGQIVGRFTPTDIQLDGQRPISTRDLKAGDHLIADVVKTEGFVFALLRGEDALSVHVLNLRDLGQTAAYKVCEKRSARLPIEGSNPSSREASSDDYRIDFGVNFGGQSDTTGVLYKQRSGTARQLVLYYHGGPASTLHGTRIPSVIQSMLDSGYDVLGVEYAGSVGGGLSLSRGLSAKPVFGFEMDAESVSSWINEQRYETVVVYSSSFGAAPALVFMTEFPEIVDGSIFVAPLLKVPSATISEQQGQQFFQSEAGSQEQFLKSAFGSAARTDEFRSWIEEYSASFEASERDLFLFGELDEKTPRSSAPRNILRKAVVVEVDKATHEFIQASNDTMDLIVDHLNEMKDPGSSSD